MQLLEHISHLFLLVLVADLGDIAAHVLATFLEEVVEMLELVRGEIGREEVFVSDLLH